MYVMSYFRTAAEALHLAISDDGLQWQALNQNQPVLTGTVGTKTLRDPFVFQAQDGQFHLFATNGWKADSIVHATSPNLINWSEQELLPVMAGVPNVRNCWAPECFYDYEAKLYRIIWSSSVTEPNGSADWNHRIWSCTTADFKSYTPAQLFLDPGYSVIDATVIRFQGQYLLAFKDERGENRIGTNWKAMRVCFAPHAEGPWTEISELITPSLTEGPTMFQREDHLVMIFDHFIEDYFGAMQSDDGINWQSITNQMQFPPGPRHASVLEVTDEVGQNLMKQLA
ncbi:MAG: glycoside hydrolase family 43 protein [Abitibacteriaceae bacterium]|nr:glycoside hydrolase family 43 protein [Abditibacteriaceae bacterium]